MPTEPSWLTAARRYVGIAEIKGPHHHSAILDLLDAADGEPGDGKTVQGTRDDETPWCASFVSGVLELAGIQSARSVAARCPSSGLSRPDPLCRRPRPGHVVVAVESVNTTISGASAMSILTNSARHQETDMGQLYAAPCVSPPRPPPRSPSCSSAWPSRRR
jgi:hypothetical protein